MNNAKNQKSNKGGKPKVKPQRNNRQTPSNSRSKGKGQTSDVRKIVKSEIRRIEREDVDPDEIRCAKQYALARSDPFSIKDLPCNPTADPGYSLRWKSTFRGTFQAGSNGAGFIVVDPYWGYNDSPCGYVSHAGYTGTGIDTAHAGVNSITLTGPFASVNFVGSKTVGFAIKVWYVGKALDAAGMMYKLRTPSNYPVVTNITSAGSITPTPINTWDAVSVRKVYYTSFLPQNDADDTYQVYTAPTTLVPQWNMGFYVDNAVSGSNFSFEICAFYEGISASASTMGAATMSPEHETAGRKVNTASLAAEHDVKSSSSLSYPLWKTVMAKGLEQAFKGYMGEDAARSISAYALGQTTKQVGLDRHIN